MKELKTKSGDPSLESPNDNRPNLRRRELLRAGLTGAPIVMTVASRPVLAQTAPNCQSPSGFVSANASNFGHNVCAGRMPSYWTGAPATSWPVNKSSAMIRDIFSGSPASGDNTKLTTVLTGSDPVKAQIVAAELNVLDGRIPSTVLTTAGFSDMWNEFANNQRFSVGNGAVWNPTELLDWLTRINSTG